MTDEIKRNIRIYIHHGYSFMEVAELTGASFVEIHRALAEEAEEREEFEVSQGKAISSETWAQIAEALRAGGKSQMAIAEECGVSTGTVNRIAKAIKDDEEGKEKEPAAAATAQGSEQKIHTDIISENGIDVKPPDEKISGENEDSSERETELHDLLKELARNELAFLRTRMRDLQFDLDKCKYKQELLCEYLGGDYCGL